MSFIGFTVGVFFFSHRGTFGKLTLFHWEAMYRICGSGEDGPIGRGADFQGNNKGMDPLSWLVEVGPIKTHPCLFGMKTS